MADFGSILISQQVGILYPQLDAKLTPNTGSEACKWVDWEGCAGFRHIRHDTRKTLHHKDL